MYRPVPPLTRPFQVSFAPQAWSFVGAMTADTFKALRAALDGIAQAPPEKDGPSPEGETHVRSALVGEWVVLYERDTHSRLLTVRNIVRRQTASGAGK